MEVLCLQQQKLVLAHLLTGLRELPQQKGRWWRPRLMLLRRELRRAVQAWLAALMGLFCLAMPWRRKSRPCQICPGIFLPRRGLFSLGRPLLVFFFGTLQDVFFAPCHRRLAVRLDRCLHLLGVGR